MSNYDRAAYLLEQDFRLDCLALWFMTGDRAERSEIWRKWAMKENNKSLMQSLTQRIEWIGRIWVTRAQPGL